MKPIRCVITTLPKEPSRKTGPQAGGHGAVTQSNGSQSASSNAPALADMRQSLQSLTKSLTSLTMEQYRDETGKNFTRRTHKLVIPLPEARQHLSTLMALNSRGTAGQVKELLKRMFALYPATQNANESVAQDWLRVLVEQPLASIFHAYEKTIREERDFAPSLGVFLAKVDEHSKRIKVRLKMLTEAIENEGGQGA